MSRTMAGYSLDPNLFIKAKLPFVESDGKRSLLRRENCLIAAFEGGLPPENVSILEIMKAMEDAIYEACLVAGFPKLNANAFNNARGWWLNCWSPPHSGI